MNITYAAVDANGIYAIKILYGVSTLFCAGFENAL